nr:Ig-like domain-containing protein [Marinifaba aquimaris]
MTSERCSENCRQFTADEIITVKAKLTLGGIPQDNETINFTTDLGTLSATSKLTDEDGNARINLTAFDNTLSSGAVTANFTLLDVDYAFEFIAGDSGTLPAGNFNFNFEKNNQAVSRLVVGEEVSLVASLSDAESNPISGQIVTFSVQQGELDTTTSLTSASGIASVSFTPTSEDLGAYLAQASVTYNNQTLTDSSPYDVISSEPVEDIIAIELGYYDSNDPSIFYPNTIGFNGFSAEQSNVEINTGASLGIQLGVQQTRLLESGQQVKERLTDALTVNFNSVCVSATDATIDSPVTTINGEAFATYQDVSCSGSASQIDTLTASVQVNNQTYTVNRSLTILPDTQGSFVFVSANPEQIALKGAGGVGVSENSTLTFQLVNSLGNPLAQVPVSFSTPSSVGGLSISPATAQTNSQGFVTTQVNAGSVPLTTVVEAVATLDGGEQLKTQSGLLVISTGMASQDNFNIAASTFNVEAATRAGTTTELTVYASDFKGNVITSGTSVLFTAEAGIIDASCVIEGVACTVTWTSSAIEPDDHRVGILATAIGHEAFTDINGNGVRDADEPFEDLAEAFLDENENGSYDLGEDFEDFNDDGVFTPADGLFNGPNCAAGCGEVARIQLRTQQLIITSGSNPKLRLTRDDTSAVLLSNESGSLTTSALQVSANTITNLTLTHADFADQILPAGTTIEISASIGSAQASIEVPNSTGVSKDNVEFGNYNLGLFFDTTDVTEQVGVLTINVNLPSSLSYTYQVEINII